MPTLTSAVPQLKEAARRARRIGLGIMGLGDMMYSRHPLRLPRGLGLRRAGDGIRALPHHAHQHRAGRARGPFEAIQGSIYDPDDLIWPPPPPLAPFELDYGRPAVDWDSIVAGIRARHPQRRPDHRGPHRHDRHCGGLRRLRPRVFALAYVRHVNDNGRDLELTYTSPLFEQALLQAGLDVATRQKSSSNLAAGCCQQLAASEAAPRAAHPPSLRGSPDITPASTCACRPPCRPLSTTRFARPSTSRPAPPPRTSPPPTSWPGS